MNVFNGKMQVKPQKLYLTTSTNVKQYAFCMLTNGNNIMTFGDVCSHKVE